MPSQCRLGTTPLFRYGTILAALALFSTGCRSAGGSRVPGMGWLAGAHRSQGVGKTEIDPTATLPAPSSITTPQTVASADRASAAPTHKTVSFEAPGQQGSGAVPASYPSTGYAQIATAPQGIRPEPNPMPSNPAGPSGSDGAHGSEYVQQGEYSAGAAAPAAGAATTWNSPASGTSPATAPPPGGSIYQSAAAPPPVTTDVAAAAGSMYGASPTDPAPAPSTTWNSPSIYPTAAEASQPAPASDPGGMPGTVAPASYSAGVMPPEAPSHPLAGGTELHTASSASQPWRPGSTSSYSRQ